MDLKAGVKSTEWWGFVVVAALAYLKSKGVVDADATIESLSQQSVDLIPYIVMQLTGVVKGYAPLAIIAGVLWAYIKRRTALKGQQLKNEETALIRP